MRHLKTISQTPSLASGVCDNVSGDLQARLCFVLEFLTGVFVPLFLPFVNAKVPGSGGGNGGGGGGGGGNGGGE